MVVFTKLWNMAHLQTIYSFKRVIFLMLNYQIVNQNFGWLKSPFGTKTWLANWQNVFFCLGRGLVGLGVLKPGGNQSSNAPFAKLCGVLVWQISGQGEYMSLQEVSRGLRCLWLKATCSPGWWFQMFSRYMFHRME